MKVMQFGNNYKNTPTPKNAQFGFELATEMLFWSTQLIV